MEEKLSGQGQEPLIKTSAVCSVREDWTVNSQVDISQVDI